MVSGILPLLALSLAGLLAPAAQPQQPPSAAPAGRPDKLVLENAFHIAGIPGLKRNARGDLSLTDGELVFQSKKKEPLVIPYKRIRSVQLLSGERYYGKTTAVAAAASAALMIPGGAFLILKKHKVDMLVVDFTNERGGRMGLVVQVPLGQGEACQRWLERFGVTVEEWEPPPEQGQ